MKKIYYTLGVLFLSSSMASATQHALKFLIESATPKRALKAIIPRAHFFSENYNRKNYSTITTTSYLEKGKAMQVFSRPTYDRIAKHILLNDESVRIDILKSFTGINSIQTATQLDGHYSPFDPFSKLRKLVNSPSSKEFFEGIKDSSDIKLLLESKENKDAPDFLRGLKIFYEDLTYAFPDHKYRSTVDFLCETNFGDVIVEFQVGLEVAKQDYWDKRALAYIAKIYGDQLRAPQGFGQLKNVIGINLLGDGSTPYWKDGDFMRDYTFMNQSGSKHKIPSLRLIQYSLGDVDLDHEDLRENRPLKQWIEFFKAAHDQQEIPPSVDEPVRKAYQMIRVDTLKKEYPELLKASDEFFSSLTEHDQAVKEKGMEEEKDADSNSAK